MDEQSKKPLVSIIVVNYNMVDFLRHMLTSLQKNAGNVSYEVILVDNASHDGCERIVPEDFPWVTFIQNSRNLGLGAAVNVGLQHAKGDYIAFLNPDLILEEHQFEHWVAWMEDHPDVGVSGPRLLNVDGTDQESCYAFPNPLIPVLRRTPLGSLPGFSKIVRDFTLHDMDREKEAEVDWVLGAAMLIRRKALDEIGQFDTRFFLYFEDADVCRRMWKVNWRVVYTPCAKIVHYYQRLSRKDGFLGILTNKVTRIHIASGIKYFLKYFGEPNPRTQKRAVA